MKLLILALSFACLMQSIYANPLVGLVLVFNHGEPVENRECTQTEHVAIQSALYAALMDADRRYLSEETVETFLTPGAFGHGLGWAMASDVIPVDDLPTGSFGHTGFTGTYAVAVPAHDLSIILLH